MRKKVTIGRKKLVLRVYIPQLGLYNRRDKSQISLKKRGAQESWVCLIKTRFFSETTFGSRIPLILYCPLNQ